MPTYAPSSDERSEEEEERNQDEGEEKDSDSDMVIESEDEDVSDWELDDSAPRDGRVTEFNL